MRNKRKKGYHIGGEQIPMFLPDSDWQAPTELPDLRQHNLVGLDTEERDDGLTTKKGPGWAGPGGGYVCGVSLAWHMENDVKTGYYPLQHPDSWCFGKEEIVRWFKDHVEAGVTFVMHNSGYDIGWLNKDLGIPVLPKIQDSGCAAYMIDENRRQYSLNALCAWRGISGKDETLLNAVANAYGADSKGDIHKFPARHVGPYAEQDARGALTLYEDLAPELEKQKLVEAYQLEIDLVPMVHAMRKRGIRIDEDALERAYEKFKRQSQEALEEIGNRVGETVTIDKVRKNEWLTRMFDRYGLEYPINPKTKHHEFQAQYMKSHPHWLPQLLVRAKSCEEAAEKFIKTYIQNFVHKGRLHAQVNQFKSESGGGTRTFRFSYGSPPLQQMPARDEEMTKEIRGAFLPEEGEEWCSVDYSQQEYRLIVHYAELLGLNKAREAADEYRRNPRADFHSMVAEMTGLDRKSAKNANFAKVYGAGIAKFAAMIGKSEEEAAAIMEQYDTKLPFNKLLFQWCQESADRRGYIKLVDGARCHFDFWTVHGEFEDDCSKEEAERRIKDINHPWYKKVLKRSRCRKALNSLIQGSAARQMKIAMRDIWRAGVTPLVQVHDELGISVKNLQQAQRVADIMQYATILRVPMVVDPSLGRTWGDAK